MENLNREAILRMLSGKTGNSSSGGGGGDIDLAGYATSIWVTENFVSIDFFRELFRAYDSNSQEILPNDTTSVVNNIKAMVGTWTEQYLTALGNDGGGGGGGGGAQYLNDLLDVQLTTPITDGQALVYNATLQKWVNGAAGVNMTTVWNALAGSTNEQINASHLSTALSGYVTTSAISDMATQTWVGQQGFATQTWVTSNFITIAYFDRLFRAYNGSTLVSHNDTTTTIDNIKAMFGFWTDFYLSALGTGGVSSVSISLSQLADVTLTSPTAGQALVYDATSSKWVNGTIQTGVSTLSSLTDVLLTSPTANQVLIWDATSSKWVNTSLKTINYQSIIGSGDISVGGGASGNYLPLTGGTLSGTLSYNFGGGAGTAIRFVAGEEFDQNGNFKFGANSGSYNIFKNNGDLLFRIYQNQNTNNPTIETYNFQSSGDIRNIWALAPNMSIDSRNEISIGKNVSTGNMAQFIFTYKGDNNDNNRLTLGFYGSGGLHFLRKGYLGIGTDKPLYLLDVNGDCRATHFVASQYLYTNHTGDSLLFNNGSKQFSIGCNSDETFYMSCFTPNVAYNGTLIAQIQYFNVTGNVTANGSVTALSDIRHKTVIKDAAVKVEDIARMPAVMYQWNDGREDKELHVGSIAQNWQTVLPEVVLKANDEEGTLSMQYGVAALVSSIIIARKVVNHEDRIKQLEKENEELKKRLNIA